MLPRRVEYEGIFFSFSRASVRSRMMMKEQRAKNRISQYLMSYTPLA